MGDSGDVLAEDFEIVAPKVHRCGMNTQLRHLVDVGDAFGLGGGELRLLDADVFLQQLEKGFLLIAGVVQQPPQKIEGALVQRGVLVVNRNVDVFDVQTSPLKVFEQFLPWARERAVLALEQGGEEQQGILLEFRADFHRASGAPLEAEEEGVEPDTGLLDVLLQGPHDKINHVRLPGSGRADKDDAPVRPDLLVRRLDDLQNLLDAELLAEDGVDARAEGIPEDVVGDDRLAAAHHDLEAEVLDRGGNQRGRGVEIVTGVFQELLHELREAQGSPPMQTQHLAVVEAALVCCE